MARLKPKRYLINLTGKFSQKNSLSRFKNLYHSLLGEMNNYSLAEKLKGGEYQTIISELATLKCVLNKYNPFYVEYTGNKPNSSIDGILHFENIQQKVEIVSMVDEQEMKVFSKFGGYSIDFEVLEPHHLTSIDTIKKQPLYQKIISVLDKKNYIKYKGFWLLISYIPDIYYMGDFGRDDIRAIILNTIQSQKRDLISSIKNIFKKVVFVPLNEGAENHHIFEWKI